MLSLQRSGSCGRDDKSQQRFTSGNCQYKLESIKLHKESRNHKSAKAIVAAKNRPCETPVVKFLLTMNSETKEKLSKLFKTCHALAIHNRPFTDYNWLCQLDEAKGVKIGKTYRNSESAKEFTKAIAQVERKSLASASVMDPPIQLYVNKKCFS